MPVYFFRREHAMAGHSSIFTFEQFLRVRRMMPLALILLITAASIFQGCDDDDPVGPSEPTSTPVPSTTPEPTITPEPTATPEPTETPMYSGEWCGRTWGGQNESDDCIDTSISFNIIDGNHCCPR